MATPLNRIDANIQALNGISASSSLPPIPHETMLDLATVVPDTKTLSSFVWGLNSDLNSAKTAPPPQPWQFQHSFGEQAAMLGASLTGGNHVAKLDPYAVQNMKQRLSDGGYLDLSPDEIANPNWLPEYGVASRQMAIDQSTAEFTGNKPGAMSATHALQVAGQLAAPSILMTAATKLGLWWDIKTIGEEAANFGSNLESWISDPFDVHKFADAFSIVLDTVTPILNWGLLLSGVGDVWLTGEALFAGASLGEGAAIAAETLSKSRFLQAGQKLLPFASSAGKGAAGIEASVGRLGERGIARSLLVGREGKLAGEASRFGKGLEAFRSKPAVESIGNTLEAWAQKKNMLMARKGVQFGMRMGLASNLEGMAGIHTQALPGISSVGDWLEQGAERHPLTAGVLDMALMPVTPIHFLEKGTFMTPLAAAGRGGTKAVFWALPGVERPVEGAELMGSFDKAIRRAYAAEPEQLAKYVDSVKTKGVKPAILELAGDEATADKALGSLTIGAVIDAHARELSSFSGTTSLEDPAGYAQYFLARRRLHSMLRPANRFDVNGTIERMVYGVHVDEGTTAEELSSSLRSAKKLAPSTAAKKIRVLQDKYRETAAEAAARGGAVHPDDMRIYLGHDGNIEYLTPHFADVGDDPAFFDVNVQELADFVHMTPAEARRAVLNMNPAGDEFTDVLRTLGSRYHEASTDARDAVYEYKRLSEADQVRRYVPERMQELADIADHHNALRQKTLSNLMSRVDHGVIEDFMVKHVGNLHRWNEYTLANDVLEHAQLAGKLDNASYRAALSAGGQRMNQLAGATIDWDKEASYGLWDLYTGLAGNKDYIKSIQQTLFSPLARQLDPSGYGFTLAKIGTVTKDESLQRISVAKYALKLLDDVRYVFGSDKYVPSKYTDMIRTLGDLAKGAGAEDITKMGARQSNKLIEEAALAHEITLADKSRGGLRRLIKYARRKGINLADVETHINADIENLANDRLWSEYYGAPTVLNYKDAEDQLRQHTSNLFKMSNFQAAAVDGVDPALVAELESRGYKLVHGADFISPTAIDDLNPGLQEISQAQVRGAKFERFFQKHAPIERKVANSRALKHAMWAELSRAKGEGRNVRLDPGELPWDGSADTEKLWDTLWKMKRDINEKDAVRLAETAHDSPLKVFSTRASVSRSPRGLPDLVQTAHRKTFFSTMSAEGYTPDEATAVWRGLKAARDTGFEHLGLVQIESKLRSQPNVVNGLKYLSQHAAADKFTSPAANVGLRAGRWGGAALGGSLAMRANRERNQGPNTITDDLSALLGGVAGYAGFNMATEHLGLSAMTGVGKIARSAEKLANSEKWLPYTYLADELAHIRDTFRFTLSPLFDASRYSHAVILQHLEEMPEGYKLALNQSPKAFQRSLARGFREGGMDVHMARDAAAERFGEIRNHFIAASRGDFDYEQIESIGGFFNSVGVLGFSPQDWMASMFGNLVEAGVDNQAAYEIARKVMTYGTHGRSAAEMSVNFVYFPFSFIKKVTTAMGQFMQSDIGRTVMLHDGMKMYQALDDQYDLSGWAKDHLPILEKAHRLNVFGYGLGLGEFGGINAPILRGLHGMPVVGNVFGIPQAAAGWGAEAAGLDHVKNLFVPQAVSIKNPEDAKDVGLAFKRLLPVYGDIQTMFNDIKEQGNVFFSKSHMTSKADVEHGWDEWRSYQKDMSAEFAKYGETWHSVMSGGGASSDYYRALAAQKRAELARTHPAWGMSFGDGVASAASLKLELDQRLSDPNPRYGDRSLAQFKQIFDQYTDTALRPSGFTWEEPSSIPPDAFSYLRAQATALAAKDPGFAALYNRFYRRLLGDIATELIP